MSKKLVLVVAAALFDVKGHVMLAQRPEGKSMSGLWEFPGGKIEKGEAPEKALIRELEEELKIKVNQTALKPLNFVSFDYPDFHLLMVLYACHEWEGDPYPVEGQKLSWVEPANLHTYDAPAADIPLFEYLAAGKHLES
jgi:8-oxo-dGTP diphosphatase